MLGLLLHLALGIPPRGSENEKERLSRDITMKRITSTLLVAALPLLGFSSSFFGSTSPHAAQQQDGQEVDEDGQPLDVNPPPEGFDSDPGIAHDIFGRRTRVRGNTFADRLKGGWQLTRMVVPGSNPRGRLAQGFMHIGDSFMSLELHALWETDSTAGVPENDVHTTFTAEYKVDSSGKMFCSTIIGSYIDEGTGELRWERAGFEREYRLKETLEELEVTFTDPETGAGQMYFRAYVPRTLGQSDIFGRNEMGSFGAKDIFGRKKAAHQGERDIYGRPVAPPEPKGTEEEEDAKRDAEKARRELGLPPKGPGGTPLSGRGGR